MVNALGSDPRSCGRNSFLLDARIVSQPCQLAMGKYFQHPLPALSGRQIDGVIRAIVKTTSGMRYRVEYGSGAFVATVSPEQIVHAEKPNAPKDVDL
jgi:hypothetical protein